MHTCSIQSSSSNDLTFFCVPKIDWPNMILFNVFKKPFVSCHMSRFIFLFIKGRETPRNKTTKPLLDPSHHTRFCDPNIISINYPLQSQVGGSQHWNTPIALERFSHKKKKKSTAWFCSLYMWFIRTLHCFWSKPRHSFKKMPIGLIKMLSLVITEMDKKKIINFFYHLMWIKLFSLIGYYELANPPCIKKILIFPHHMVRILLKI